MKFVLYCIMGSNSYPADREYIEPRWLPSKRLLCILRNPNMRTTGKLEWYRIE